MILHCFKVEFGGLASNVAVRGDAIHAVQTAMRLRDKSPFYPLRGDIKDLSVEHLLDIEAIDLKDPFKEKPNRSIGKKRAK